MEKRDRDLLPAQQPCSLHQAMPGINMYFWLSRRVPWRLQHCWSAALAKKQMENADLAVLGHSCWALLLQFTENLNCKKILPEGSKSLQLLVFHIVILNCCEFPCAATLCFLVCNRLAQGGVTLAQHILRWVLSDSREHFPGRTPALAGSHALGHIEGSPQNPWGSPQAALPGICLPVGSGEAQSSHTSPLRQDWGAVSPRLYFMLNALICCSKVLWASTWQSTSQLKKIIKIAAAATA